MWKFHVTLNKKPHNIILLYDYRYTITVGQNRSQSRIWALTFLTDAVFNRSCAFNAFKRTLSTSATEFLPHFC